MLLQNDIDENINSKQDKWIKYYIDNYNSDKDRMKFLFEAILDYPNERRKKFQELKKMLTQGVKFDFLYGI